MSDILGILPSEAPTTLTTQKKKNRLLLSEMGKWKLISYSRNFTVRGFCGEQCVVQCQGRPK